LTPLGEIKSAFAFASRSCRPFADDATADTAEQRAGDADNPPEILITTPESLNILPLRKRRAQFLAISKQLSAMKFTPCRHKRGTHLITADRALDAAFWRI